MASQERGRSTLMPHRDTARSVAEGRLVIEPAAYPYRGLILRFVVGLGSPPLDKGLSDGQKPRKNAEMRLGYAGRRVLAYAQPYGQLIHCQRDGHG